MPTWHRIASTMAWRRRGCFSDEAPREVVFDGQMLYAGGAAVALRENTVLDPNPPTLAFALPDVATGMTDVEEWESRAAATVLLGNREGAHRPRGGVGVQRRPGQAERLDGEGTLRDACRRMRA